MDRVRLGIYSSQCRVLARTSRETYMGELFIILDAVEGVVSRNSYVVRMQLTVLSGWYRRCGLLGRHVQVIVGRQLPFPGNAMRTCSTDKIRVSGETWSTSNGFTL